MRRSLRWYSRQHVRWLASASLTLLVLALEACGGGSDFTQHGCNGGCGPVGVSHNTFAGKLLFVKAGNIFLLNGSDDSLTQVTSDGSDFQPAISRDGKTLVFEVRKPGGEYSDLATMPLSGGSLTMLTDDSLHLPPGEDPHAEAGDRPKHYEFWASNPIWTGDGQNIIYLSDLFKGKEMTPNRANQTCPGLSDGPNANWIIDPGIVEIPADAHPIPALKDPPKQLAWPYCFAGGDQFLSLRPGVSDTEILFTSFRYIPPQHAEFTAQLSLLILAPGEKKQLIQLSPEDSSAVTLEPSWSPDGKYITYIRRENGQDNLYIMSVDTTITGTSNNESYLLEDGSNSSYFTNTSYYMKAQKLASGIIGNPVWGSNNTLFFLMFENGEYNLYMAKVKVGSPPATPTTAPGTTPTAGSPGQGVISLDGSPVQLTQGGIDGDSQPVWLGD